MYTPKKSVLIIVRGVHLEDLVYEQPAVSQIFTRSAVEDVPQFTAIPKKFTGVDNWPHTSNLACWHCDQIPGGYPAFIPTNVSAGEHGDVCDVFGHFCTWNCAVSYVDDHFRDDLKWDAKDSIRTIVGMFNGEKPPLIVAAPPKTLMSKYCGGRGLSSREWYDLLAQGCAAYNNKNFKFESMKES